MAFICASSPHSHHARLFMAISIVVIVVASVAGLLVLVTVLSLIWRRRRRKSAPLPPIQPLAHQRERKINHFHERQASAAGSISRPGTWYRPTPPFAHQSRVNAGTGSEDTLSESLLRQSSILSAPSEAQFSSVENMELKAPSMSALEIPRPRSAGEMVAFPGSSSSSSLPSGSNPTSPTPSPAPASHSQSQPRSRSQSRQRPTSMVSSTSTSRMLPHGPHSTIQIIMPAPLALQPEEETGDRGRYMSPSRVSLADPWASAAVGSGSGPSSSVLEKKSKSSRSRSRHRSQTRDATVESRSSMSSQMTSTSSVPHSDSHSSHHSMHKRRSQSAFLAPSPLGAVPPLPGMPEVHHVSEEDGTMPPGGEAM